GKSEVLSLCRERPFPQSRSSTVQASADLWPCDGRVQIRSLDVAHRRCLARRDLAKLIEFCLDRSRNGPQRVTFPRNDVEDVLIDDGVVAVPADRSERSRPRHEQIACVSNLAIRHLQVVVHRRGTDAAIEFRNADYHSPGSRRTLCVSTTVDELREGRQRCQVSPSRCSQPSRSSERLSGGAKRTVCSDRVVEGTEHLADRCLLASSRNFHVELCDIAQTQVWRHVGVARIHADLAAPLTGGKPILEILSDKNRPLRESEITYLRA